MAPRPASRSAFRSAGAAYASFPTRHCATITSRRKSEESGIGETNKSFNSSIVDLGLGFVFGDRLSLQPLAHVPLSGDDDEVTFGVFASFSFGWKAK